MSTRGSRSPPRTAGRRQVPERIARRRAAARRRTIRRRRLTALTTLALAVGVPVVVLGAGGGAPGPAASLSWLADTEGSPASIADENGNAGSGAWRLPADFRRRGRVDAYVSSQDAFPGDTERIYLNAPGARSVRVRIFRIGWYGGAGARLVAISRRLPAISQHRCRHDDFTGLTECRWREPLSFELPEALVSGVYVARADTDRGAARECIFVVESRDPGPAIAQIPTATYEAYNGYGGDSLYPGVHTTGATGVRQGVEVSYDRPYDSTGVGQFLRGDVAMVRFLEREGYPVSYTTSTGVDLHGKRLRGRRLAIDLGHSEYWSARAARAFERARDAGANLAFFSSDTLAWRVRFAPATRASSEAGAPDHRIIAYKEYSGHDPRGQPATFPDGGASLTGGAYQGCITPRVPPGRRATYHYYAWRPGRRLAPSWLYRGTSLTPRSRVRGIVGYELNSTTAQSRPAVTRVGSGAAPCASLGRRGSADTTLYRARSGAIVFATGTLGWQLGLEPVPQASPDAPRRPDPRLVRLTENLISALLRQGGPGG